MLNHIDRFHQFKKLLNKLGNPHLKIPPTIHVAGTNGKGSTIAIMRAILEASGYRVHCFTSPHLIDIKERFVCASLPLSQAVYDGYYQLTQPLQMKYNLGFFQHLTLMAFLIFSQHPADFCLMEVGVGGQYDPTNVIANPLASVITTIDYDHTEVLGLTINDIAKAKAGIIRPTVPVFTTVQDLHALKAISAAAASNQSALIKLNQNFRYKVLDNQWNLTLNEQVFDLDFPINLIGDHQLTNAALAVVTLKTVLVDKITFDHIKDGIKHAKWPGRLEMFNYKGRTIWFDGAHNPEGAVALTRFFKPQNKKLHIIVGQQLTKNTIKFIENLEPITEQIYLVHIDEPDALFNVIKEIININYDTEILITGSLYLYPHFKKILKS